MNLDKFKSLKKEKPVILEQLKEVVGYTRVSSKEQLKNFSLSDQTDGINNFLVANSNFYLDEWVGGTCESATGDMSRKEFVKLIEFIKKRKQKPYAIAIHFISRFSRTGGGAISIVEDLLKLGVHLIETSSGLCTAIESDKIKIWEKLIQAKKENVERLERTLPGMIKLLKSGNWLGKAPKGYTMRGKKVTDFTRIQEKQEIFINDDGKLLKKAWKWKVAGERDFVILQKLEKQGLTLRKQWLSQMWRNPFYCGISNNELLEKSVKGNWEAMVSIEDFWVIQAALNPNNLGKKSGNIHELRPLTKFLKCNQCSTPLTSYEVATKGVHYYKCQNCKGVSFNCNTTPKSLGEGLNSSFEKFLEGYTLPEKYVEPFTHQLIKMFENMNEDAKEEIELYKKTEKEILDMKIILERKFVTVENFSSELYDKYMSEYNEKLSSVRTDIAIAEKKISNHSGFIEKSLNVVQNLSKYWASEPLENKIRIQSLVFPEGVRIEPKNRQYLTTKVNKVFELTSTFTGSDDEVENKKPTEIIDGSSLVAGTGLEPVTFGL